MGARVTMGGAPGRIEALPERGWWKLRLDGEETVRSARRDKFEPASSPPATAPFAPWFAIMTPAAYPKPRPPPGMRTVLP